MATVVHSLGPLSCSRTTPSAPPRSSIGSCCGRFGGLRGFDLESNVVLPKLGRSLCFSIRAEAMGVGLKTRTVTLEANVGGNLQNLLPFVKYHGLGNDFILVDNRQCSTLCITAEQAAKLCDRNFGVGGDGVIFVLPGVNGSDYSMRIINSDGSEPEMCGNGIRCMAKFIAELEGATEARSYKVDTLAGLIVPELREDGQVNSI